MMKDLEKNNFDIENQDGLIKTEEINISQTGRETFRGGQENYYYARENYTSVEINQLDDKLNTPDNEDDKSNGNDAKKQNKTLEKQSANVSSINGAASGIGASAAVLPGVAVSLVSVVTIIGVSTGLIHVAPTNNVSNFLRRSTELGFKIDREPDKPYLMQLSNDNYSREEAVDLIDQVVFTDLIPDTIYDLTVYEADIEPYKLVYSTNYLTTSYDDYSTTISNISQDNDLLTFHLDYEGDDINFVTIVIYGDNNKVIYTYEGAPINELTVNVAEYRNVTCEVSINGQLTHFEQLLATNKIIHVESIAFETTDLKINVGDSYALRTTILPEDATNKELVWTSTNENVATVNDGVITAFKTGQTTITAKSVDGFKTASAKVVVNKTPQIINVESVSLDKTSLELETGDKYILKANVLPTDANDKSVTWTSSDKNVVTVNDGVIEAVGAGSAIITATTTDGGYTATCEINVTRKIVPVTGIGLDNSELEINVRNNVTLVATVIPSNATNQELIWLSTNSDVASVDNGGVVTANSEGEAIITVETVDGGYKTYCLIKVIA